MEIGTLPRKDVLNSREERRQEAIRGGTVCMRGVSRVQKVVARMAAHILRDNTTLQHIWGAILLCLRVCHFVIDMLRDRLKTGLF